MSLVEIKQGECPVAVVNGPAREARHNPLQRLIKQEKSPSRVGMKQERLQDAGRKTVCVYTGCTHLRALSHDTRAVR